MAGNYYKRSGDRQDGRRIRSIGGFFNFMPFIMSARNDATNYYDDSFEITNAERWFKKQRDDGYKGMGMLHLIIAAYVRCVALFPALNRFVAGRRIYAHNDIEVIMVVKRSMSLEAPETTIKVRFDPSDTVYDVYRKMNRAIEDARSESDGDSADAFAEKFVKMPRFILRILMGIFRILDYFGWLPNKILGMSPFHGSMIITDLGSLGIGPVFHHIYKFGTLPLFISFGAKRRAYEIESTGKVEEKKYIDVRFSIDERIADGHYFAEIFKQMKRYIKEPSLLEIPPEVIKRDIR